MADNENLVLEMLRRIRGSQERMELDVQDIKSRMTGIEVNMGQISSQLVSQSLRMDRIEERVSRIERRLDLVELH
jgi:archaellum component FlaC